MRCRLSALRSALVAALLGLAFLATPANAAPAETRETSLQTGINNFVAYLKSETNEAMALAARLARDHQDSLAAAKSYLERHLSAWRDLLSDRKATAETLGEDAATTWEAWLEDATASWAEIERQAAEVLDWIQSWLRSQSSSEGNAETPV